MGEGRAVNCQLRACMHDTKWPPGEASNGRGGEGGGGGGGGGGIDLSPMDMATQASRLSCIYVYGLRFLIHVVCRTPSSNILKSFDTKKGDL